MDTTYPSFIKPFGVSVFVIRQNHEGWKYLLLRRSSAYLTGNWQMVSGKSEPEEKAWQTALREIKEEAGLQVARLYSADYIETFYEARKDAIVIIPVFVAFVEGEQEVTISPKEHDSYRWLSYTEALVYLEFGPQRAALKHIEENFIRREPNELFRIDF